MVVLSRNEYMNVWPGYKYESLDFIEHAWISRQECEFEIFVNIKFSGSKSIHFQLLNAI
jgi:hypothetical protein